MTLSQEKPSPSLCQMLTDFQNSLPIQLRQVIIKYPTTS